MVEPAGPPARQTGMRRFALLTALSVVPFLWLGAEPAVACSCVQSSLPDFVERADVVGSGRLVEREYVRDGQDVVYTFAGTGTFEGELPPEFDVRSSASSASCGIEGLVVGRDYLLFLEDEDGALSANLCGGTRRLTPGYADRVAALTGPVESSDRGPEGPAEVVLRLVASLSWWG